MIWLMLLRHLSKNSARANKQSQTRFGFINQAGISTHFRETGNWPQRYDPLVDERTGADAQSLLAGLHRVIKETTLGMPTHDKYIRRYCKAPS